MLRNCVLEVTFNIYYHLENYLAGNFSNIFGNSVPLTKVWLCDERHYVSARLSVVPSRECPKNKLISTLHDPQLSIENIPLHYITRRLVDIFVYFTSRTIIDCNLFYFCWKKNLYEVRCCIFQARKQWATSIKPSGPWWTLAPQPHKGTTPPVGDGVSLGKVVITAAVKI